MEEAPLVQGQRGQGGSGQLPCKLLQQLQAASAPPRSSWCGGDGGGEDGEGHDEERGRDVVQVRGRGQGRAGEGGRQPLWHLETVSPDDPRTGGGEGSRPDTNKIREVVLVQNGRS